MRDTRTGVEEDRECHGLFLLLGAEPHCDWLPDAVARDPRGFVLTGRDVPPELGSTASRPANLETTCRGCSPPATSGAGSMKRVAAASGEGASVVPLVHGWLDPGEGPGA